MISPESNELMKIFAKIPGSPEHSYGSAKVLAISSLALILFSGSIAITLALILKYQANHTAYFDSPSGGIRMVFSYVPACTNYIVSSSVFTLLTASGAITIAFRWNHAKKEFEQRHQEAVTNDEQKGNLYNMQKNSMTLEEIYTDDIKSLASVALPGVFLCSGIALIILTSCLGFSANKSNDIHITNQSTIDELAKKAGTLRTWKDVLPGCNFNSFGDIFRDISTTRVFSSTSYSSINYAMLIVYGVLLGMPMLTCGVCGLILLVPDYESNLAVYKEKFLKLSHPEQSTIFQAIAHLEKKQHYLLPTTAIKTLIYCLIKESYDSSFLLSPCIKKIENILLERNDLYEKIRKVIEKYLSPPQAKLTIEYYFPK